MISRFSQFHQFYQCFIQRFSKIAGQLILIFKTCLTLIVSQSSINAAGDDKVGKGEGDGNKTNLSN